MPDVGLILASVALVGLSACFSGLTLGLLSLSLESLELIVSGGSAREAAWARKIYPMRRHGNLLLCTLLLGNTLVNVLISIFSAQFLSPGLGAIMASLVIVVFGEIIPQSVCSRHGLRIGAASRPLVVPLMFAFLPVTWPIARLLDFALGSEMRTMYNKRQLDRLLDINAAAVDISTESCNLLAAAVGRRVTRALLTALGRPQAALVGARLFREAGRLDHDAVPRRLYAPAIRQGHSHRRCCCPHRCCPRRRHCPHRPCPHRLCPRRSTRPPPPDSSPST